MVISTKINIVTSVDFSRNFTVLPDSEAMSRSGRGARKTQDRKMQDWKMRDQKMQNWKMKDLDVSQKGL